ncbi:MAG TPA: MATE family efflux transporter [Vicinamibacteria bacterium]|nr:MATE family efflux transporter [Vicinamibacteria bacterium]
MAPRERLRRFWTGRGGGREVLLLAYPLILAHVSFVVQTFVDRLFLTWYSAEAVAGAVTALFATLAVIMLFTGTGEYLTTFIAQYVGAGRPHRVGPALWQGVYFSAAAGVFIASLAPLAGPVFALAGHEPLVMQYEVTYASILLRGAFPVVLMATLSTFFAGRGETRVVLLVNLLATAANVVLDALWIFGRAGFPRAGVAGAAWSTVVSQVLGSAVFLALILRPRYRQAYATASGWRFERALFLRLLRFGFPTGLQYSLEILAFAIFMMIVGRIGTAELAASGITFNLNMIVFTPMLGLGVAVSALVGRHLGGDDPAAAERATWSALWMSLVYMVSCGALYLLAPRALLFLHGTGADPAAFAEVERISVVLLRFVALYSIFDMLNVMFAAGLRGAGDTVYPMAATVLLAFGAMLVPTYLACIVFGAGVQAAWTAASLYVFLLGMSMRRRFRAGRWRSLRVIEPALPDLQGAAARA